MEEKEERIVFAVYYDRCMPESPLRDIMPKVAPFARHVFPGWENSDYDMVTKTVCDWKKRFPDTVCFFLTLDGKDFRDNARMHPAVIQKAIHVEVFDASLYHDKDKITMHYMIARDAAGFLSKTYCKRLLYKA